MKRGGYNFIFRPGGRILVTATQSETQAREVLRIAPCVAANERFHLLERIPSNMRAKNES
jgi:hypothetical protein